MQSNGRTILSIDPGGTTGIALRMTDGSVVTSTCVSAQELWGIIESKPDEVVYEIFSTQGRVDRYMLYTVELVGSIKGLCHALQIPGFAHTPQRRKPWMKEANDLIKLAKRPYVVHEVDALAHLLAHEYKK